MTANGLCEKCGKLTSFHYTNEPKGWFCSEACRAMAPTPDELPLTSKKRGALDLAGAPKKEPTPAEIEAKKLEVEKLFSKFIADGKLAVEDTPDGPKYLIARFTLDKEEAVAIVERLDMISHFDRIKQICFVNGMVDGITTYRREIRKLGGISMDKAVKVGNAILDYIAKERVKI